MQRICKWHKWQTLSSSHSNVLHVAFEFNMLNETQQSFSISSQSIKLNTALQKRTLVQALSNYLGALLKYGVKRATHNVVFS